MGPFRHICAGVVAVGFLLTALLIFNQAFFYTQRVLAAADDDTATSTLQKQVDETALKIMQLQKEITQLQTQLNTTAAQKQTLKNTINQISLNIQKLQKSISLANAQITQKNKQIGQLSTTIATTSQEIAVSQSQVAGALRELAAQDAEPMLGVLLSGGTLSSFFDHATELAALRSGLQDRISNLSLLKGQLQESKTKAEQKKGELTSLQTNLSQQKQGLSINKDAQGKILVDTQNKESVYQTQIAIKKQQQAEFEAELAEFESKLNLIVDLSAIPSEGTEALAWPLDSVRITQYFGNTSFAQQHAAVYNGKGHGGIDLAASPGTPIRAALSGVVLGIGNTDITCPGASYGKWVFIKHANGLETLYAHLSVFKVSKGQEVNTGDVIGYSGLTGYATGPHLHFGVYAASGSEIASFSSKSCKGRTYTMPVAELSAYLNPLSYLPPVRAR